MLTVDSVSIGYYMGDIKDIGLKDYVINKLKGKDKGEYFWAIQDVSFQLEKGDLLGIIGRNGAGKSTLLKAITGIMKPTKGSVCVNGNVSALLELGSGFDPDLTVQENVYLRGALLGYSRKFIQERYNSIIDFAEIRDFQYRPFRQLSSGMKTRIAFSISCLVDPELLILDEVLSVGDGAFKYKSEAKMMEIIKSDTTTILVSHSLAQIKRLANKVLWLDKGKQIEFGESREICDKYYKFLKGK